MTTPATRDEFIRAQRWSLTAATWFAKAAVGIAWLHKNARGERRWLASYDATRLLIAVLRDADQLVPCLDEHQIHEVLERAESLVKQLHRLRLAAKLEKVEGRTRPEAEAFQAKATALRDER